MKDKAIQFIDEHEEVIKSCKNWFFGALLGIGVTMITLSDYGERKYSAGYSEGAKSGLLAGVTMSTRYHTIQNRRSSDNNKN